VDIDATDGSASITTVKADCSLANWSANLDLSSLADGTDNITITVTHTDSVGNTGSVFDTTSKDSSPPVLVSIEVTPPTPSIGLNYDQQFTATGTYSDESAVDITDSVTWTSSAAGVATIGE